MMWTHSDYNSIGFLALILVGIMLAVAGLVLMSAARLEDRPVQFAAQHRVYHGGVLRMTLLPGTEASRFMSF